MLLGRLVRSSSFKEAQVAAPSFLLLVNIEGLLGETAAASAMASDRAAGSFCGLGHEEHLQILEQEKGTVLLWQEQQRPYLTEG